jgi:hypothetical protein
LQHVQRAERFAAERRSPQLQSAIRSSGRHGGILMLLEILRLGVAFGTMGLIIAFWYWFMDSVGTF